MVSSLAILQSFYTYVSEIINVLNSLYGLKILNGIWVCRILYNSLNVLVDRSSDILTLFPGTKYLGWIEF